MRIILLSSILIVLVCGFLLTHNIEYANALPISYNVTALLNPGFININRGGSNVFELFTEAGYNGTVNALYQGYTKSTIEKNSTLVYKLGYHPTLPITLDTKNNITASASIAATQSLPLTIASGHSNVAIVVGIIFEHTTNIDHNKARMSSVTIGGFPLTLLLNKTVTCGAASCDSEIWALGNNTALTGAQTITITPSDVTNYHMVAGAYSLYNTRSVRPIDALASNTGTSVTPSVSVTRSFTSSYMMDNMITLQTGTPSANSDTREWVGHTTILSGGSQLKLSPASGANSLTWTTTNVQWISTGVEIIPIQNQVNFNYNLAWDSNYIPTTLTNGDFVANGSKIYYTGYDSTGADWVKVESFDTLTGIETHLGQMQNVANCQEGNNVPHFLFVQRQSINMICGPNVGSWIWNSVGGNYTGSSTNTLSNDESVSGPVNIWFNGNNTSTTDSRGASGNSCVLTLIGTNATTTIDAIACDQSIPNHADRFWHGMKVYKIGNYYSVSSLSFYNKINTLSSTNRASLTLPNAVLGTTDPDVRLLGYWFGGDYIISVSANTIKYIPASYMTSLLSENRAYQPYLITYTTTSSLDELGTPMTSIQVYGPALNTTISTFGMITLPSGYTMKATSQVTGTVRTIDPQWTNTPTSNFPAISTTTSLFPVYLTVTNAPSNSGLMVSAPSQVINTIAGLWSLTSLDATNSAEFDIPAGTCANISVGDISKSPVIYIYQGQICATGVNQKTIQYTNTIPLSFYTMTYGATSSFTPSTNGLAVTTRATVANYTENIIIKNSTGAISQNFTKFVSGIIDTHTFNVTNATKPATLSVTIVGKGLIYSSYLGSALSFASVVSFFHQYLNYQGFDLLAFIPLIFASMFTRSTVGIGAALTVVAIATLSFLSVTVVSDTLIGISVIISIIAMIGYRALY